MHAFFRNLHESTIPRELFAGLTTFSTMAYILLVNPVILSEAGMDFGAVMVATALISGLSSLLMGLYAGYPFALAPGMGINAFFAYTLVVHQGLSWQTALGATFLAGVLFFFLNLVGFRELIIRALPDALRAGITAGIGLFIAFIGLQNMGLVTSDPVTLVTLGNVQSPEVLLAAFGLVLATALLVRGVPAAVLISILATWLLSLATGHTKWQGLFSLPPSVMPTLGQMDLWSALCPENWPAVFAITFIALFDAAGSVTSLGELGGFFNAKKKLPYARRVFYVDAIGTMGAGLTGTSPMTIYLESAAGIAAGGRSGLTSLVVAVLFLAFLFLFPLAHSIPAFATSAALLLIGAQMLAPLSRLPFNDPAQLVSAFVMVLTIPLTFSISDGIALALILYPAIQLLAGRMQQVHGLLWVLALLCICKFIWIGF